MRWRTWWCLLLVCGSVATGRAADYAYTINSEPSGLLSGGGTAAAGTVITTSALGGEISGKTFGYWKINGVRQSDAKGMALSSVKFTLTAATTATAVFFPTADDSDGDGLPDWWEWRYFGAIARPPTGDADGDGLDYATEYRRGLNPLLADTIADGGVSARRSEAIDVPVPTSADYIFNSEPSGLLSGGGTAAAGTVITTPALGGEISGKMFGYWKIDGVRQSDTNGMALSSVKFTLTAANTMATAVFFPTADDSDGDGLPDWWEWRHFGAIARPPTGDADGDGLDYATEYRRGLSPLLADTIVDGGVSTRRSAAIDVPAATDAIYVFNSEPSGLVNQSGIAARGTVMTTPALTAELSGRRFAYWKIDGVRQAAANGIARQSVSFTLAGDTTVTAVYILTTDDTDGDGLPDWWEWQQFGSLAQTGAGDLDGDGVDHATEYRRGTSARLVDLLVDGGISARRSAEFINTVPPPDVVAVSPARQVDAGGAVTLEVTPSAWVPFTYQWQKDGVAIFGATNATYTLPAATVGQAGLYRVVISNAGGSVTSGTIAVGVVPTGTGVAHKLRGAGFAPGGAITVVNTITYAGTASSLDWQVLLPEGWRFVGDAGSVGSTRPAAGTTSLLTWEWTTVPPSPVTFSYTIQSPTGEVTAREIAALANARLMGPAVKLLARPDPLRLPPGWSIHSADTNADGQLDLLELTRVIELYNARNGSVRTGAYAVQEGSEDGFASDSTRPRESPPGLARYHTADTRGEKAGTPPDGAIDLFELTRVIELYNTRADSVRTGAYHVQAGTEDGFAPGPGGP